MSETRSTGGIHTRDGAGRVPDVHVRYKQQPVTGNTRRPRFAGAWEVTALGDRVAIRNGGTPRTGVPSYWGGEIPWCVPTDITACRGKYLGRTTRDITPEGLASCGASLLPAGALLLCSRATIGEVKIASMPVATNQGFKSMICGESVDHEFLYYSLLTLKKQMMDVATGSTFLEINKRDVGSIPLDLPPLPEQRAIAAALSNADELIGSVEALIAKKRDIKHAAMQQLLTGTTRLPGFGGEWETNRLGDLGMFCKGRGIRRDELGETGVRCVRYGELYTRYENYVVKPVSRIPQHVADSALPIKQGDLLFAGSGETADEIGICVAYIGDQPAYAGGDLIVLRTSGQDAVYLAHLLNTPVAARQKARMAQGDTVVHIRGDHLAEVEFPLPSLPEQQAIATILYDMDAEIAALEHRLDKTRAIKQGMMQQLLTGTIRLPIPNDDTEDDHAHDA